MLRRNSIVGCILWFVLVFGVLAAPWPGLRGACCNYLQGMVRTVLSSESGRRELDFEVSPNHKRGYDEARIVIVNRDLMTPNGSGPVRNLDIDLGTLGTRSLALLLALICATPFSWKRRGIAILLGIPFLHFFILALIAYCIWSESTEVQLVTLSPAMKEIANSLEERQLALFSIVVPVLVWVVVTFRRSDRTSLFTSMNAADNKKAR